MGHPRMVGSRILKMLEVMLFTFRVYYISLISSARISTVSHTIPFLGFTSRRRFFSPLMNVVNKIGLFWTGILVFHWLSFSFQPHVRNMIK